MPSDYATAALALAAFWAVSAFSRGPVRRALANGLRALFCYADLWRIPAMFGLGYAIFQVAATLLLQHRLGVSPALLSWGHPPSPADLIAAGWLAAAERTNAVFTVFVATFPLSAWFALVFLCNAGGLFAELVKAVRKRFTSITSGLLICSVVLAAVAAIAKPFAYLLLPEVANHVPFYVPLTVNALSSAFEFCLGIYFLTYLMLMTHAWLRGIHFYRDRMRILAMRRTGYVLKWSLLMVVLAAIFVELPIYAGMLTAPGESFYNQCEWFSTWIGRSVVTAIALLYCPAQIILVFHNESLRQALRDARALIRRHWTSILPFLCSVYAAFFAIQMATDYGCAWAGGESLAGLGVRALAALIEAYLAGWLIASWVCLYKSLSTGRKEILF
jgi:hypothetical protein